MRENGKGECHLGVTDVCKPNMDLNSKVCLCGKEKNQSEIKTKWFYQHFQLYCKVTKKTKIFQIKIRFQSSMYSRIFNLIDFNYR